MTDRGIRKGKKQMNKKLTKIAGLSLGIAMAIGVGIAISHGEREVEGVKADTSYTEAFTIKSSDVVSNSGYTAYNTSVDGRDWVITFGGNNKSVGTNSGNRSKCNLSSYSKYAVSPVTTSVVASAFVGKSSISDIGKVSYTIGGGSNQTNTKVYLIYSSDNSTFAQVTLTSGTQGAAISSGTEYTFGKCSGYFGLLFEATNSSGNWRIDDVNVTFYTEENAGPQVNEVTVAPETLDLDLASEDLTAELTATITADEGAEYTVEWVSDNDQVATVEPGNTEGKATVTAVGVGEANVTVSAGGIDATCVVTVTNSTIPTVHSVSVTPNTLSLDLYNEDHAATLTADVDADEGAQYEVEWASDNDLVAIVENGVVTAVSVGEATISVTAGGKSATCAVTVVDTTPIPNDYFIKYEDDITEGDYLIVYDGKAMNNVTTGNRLQFAEVTEENDVILNPQTNSAIVWHIAPKGTEGEYTLQNRADSSYAASTGSKNQATTAAVLDENGKTQWTIAKQNDGTFEIVNVYNAANSTNSYLRENGTYGFACYATGTGGSLSLYQLKGPSIQVVVEDNKTTLAPEETANVTATLLYGATGAIEFTSSDESVITVAPGDEAGTAVVTGISDGSADLIVSVGEDLSVSVPFSVSSAAYLSKIEIAKEPNKTVYHPGEELDLTGLEVNAVYSNGTEVPLDTEELTIGEYNFAIKGEKEITLSWTDEDETEKSTTLVVNVEYELLTPSQAIQKVKDNGDAETDYIYRVSGVVTRKGTWSDKYSNGDIYVADSYNLTGKENEFELWRITDKDAFDAVIVNSLITVESKLTVYGEQYETTQNPTVISYDANPDHVVMSLQAELADPSVFAGDSLDLSALVVTGKDNYGEDVTVAAEDYTTNASELDLTQPGKQTLVITHTASGYTASVEITVKAVELAGVELVTPPGKSEYLSSESIDLTGLVVKEVYNNGHEVEVVYSEENKDLFSVEPEVAALGTELVKVTYKGEEISYEITVTISPLDEAKQEAINAVEAYFEGVDYSLYSQANQEVLNGIKANALEDINSAQDVADIDKDAILAQVAGLVEAVPTIEEEEAAALAEAKANANTALDEYYAQFNLEDYDEAGQLELSTALANGKTGVEEATTIAEVEAAVEAAKNAMKAVQTAAQKALAEAKANGKNALDSYVSESDYREAQWQQIQGQISSAKDQIDAATTVQDVEDIVTAAKAAIDLIPTDSQMTLDEAKAAAKVELDNLRNQLVNTHQYTDAQLTQLGQALQAGKDAIDGATTVEGVNNAKANAQQNMNNVPYITGIVVTKLPDKVDYQVGDALDLTGLEVKVTYSDGTQELVRDFSIDDIDMNEVGEATVTVRYNNQTVTFTININAIPAPARRGCGGSIAATSALLSLVAIGGVALISLKKRKEK